MAWRCGASRAARDAVRKPWEAASGRAGEPPEGVGKPCRCPTSPAAPLLPGGSPARSLGVNIKDLWYYLRELAILVAARFWSAQFEWHAHARIAGEEGLDEAVIAAIAAGEVPALESPEQAIVYGFCRELHETHAVRDETYARAVELLGQEAVIELTVLCGYYTAVSMILNIFQVPLPDGVAPPLAPL